MAKRTIRNPEAMIKRRLKYGRGQGVGSDYKPWTVVQSGPSSQLVFRELGWKTNRLHHLMSPLHLDFFYTLEWDEAVLDIQEYFPLPREDTQTIALIAGLHHPTYPESEVARVLTTDFIVTRASARGSVTQARAVLPADIRNSGRLSSVLEIQRLYWANYHVDWNIVREAEIPRTLAWNVSVLRNYRAIADRVQLAPTEIGCVARELTFDVLQYNAPLARLASSCDDRHALTKGTSLAVAYHLLAIRRWRVDMDERIEPGRAVKLTGWDQSLTGGQ